MEEKRKSERRSEKDRRCVKIETPLDFREEQRRKDQRRKYPKSHIGYDARCYGSIAGDGRVGGGPSLD